MSCEEWSYVGNSLQNKKKKTTIHHSKAAVPQVDSSRDRTLSLPVGGHQHPTNPPTGSRRETHPKKVTWTRRIAWCRYKVKNFEKQMKVQLGVEGVVLRPEAALSRIHTLILRLTSSLPLWKNRLGKRKGSFSNYFCGVYVSFKEGKMSVLPRVW